MSACRGRATGTKEHRVSTAKAVLSWLTHSYTPRLIWRKSWNFHNPQYKNKKGINLLQDTLVTRRLVCETQVQRLENMLSDMKVNERIHWKLNPGTGFSTSKPRYLRDEKGQSLQIGPWLLPSRADGTGMEKGPSHNHKHGPKLLRLVNTNLIPNWQF